MHAKDVCLASSHASASGPPLLPLEDVVPVIDKESLASSSYPYFYYEFVDFCVIS